MNDAVQVQLHATQVSFVESVPKNCPSQSVDVTINQHCVYMWVFIMHTGIYYIAHVVDIDMFSFLWLTSNLESFKPSNATYS